MQAQPLTVLPIQSVRNPIISNADLSTFSGSSRISSGTHGSSRGSSSKNSSRKTEMKAPPPPAPSPPPKPIPKIPKLSLKSRLEQSIKAEKEKPQPTVNPIKLIRKDADKSPNATKKVFMLKEIPLAEKEAILRGSVPLRTPTQKLNIKIEKTEVKKEPEKTDEKKEPVKESIAKEVKSEVISTAKESVEVVKEVVKPTPEIVKKAPVKPEVKPVEKVKIEPARSKPLFSKNTSTTAKKTDAKTTKATGRSAPRKTPTPPNTPGSTPPRPTKTETKTSAIKSKSAHNWTSQIVDNNSTIMRQLPQGNFLFSSIRNS
jgi:hypothetical protein